MHSYPTNQGLILMTMARNETQWALVVREVSRLEKFLAKENRRETKTQYHITTRRITSPVQVLEQRGEVYGFYIPLDMSEGDFLAWMNGEETQWELQMVFCLDVKDPVCNISRLGLTQLILTKWFPRFRERIMLYK